MRFRSTEHRWMPFSRPCAIATTARGRSASGRLRPVSARSSRPARGRPPPCPRASRFEHDCSFSSASRDGVTFSSSSARHPTLQMVEFVRDRDVSLAPSAVDAALQVEAEPQCLVRQPPRRLPRFDGDEIRRRVPAEEDDQSDRRPQPPAQPRRHFLPPSFFASPAFARRRSTLRRSILRRTPFVSSISSVNTSSVVPTTRPWMPPLVTT